MIRKVFIGLIGILFAIAIANKINQEHVPPGATPSATLPSVTIDSATPIPARAVKPGDYDFSLQHGGLTRKYRVHVPPAYTVTKSSPVVVYLHGGGGSIAADNDMPLSSDKLGFLLIIPEGTGKKFFGKLRATWNAGSWAEGICCGEAAEHTVDDVGFITRVLDEVEKNYTVDTTRIYVTGMSNGGMMAMTMACELADRIAAVAPVAAPAVAGNCAPARNMPILYTHGTADPCLPYAGGINEGCVPKIPRHTQAAQSIVNFWKEHNSCSDTSNIAYSRGKASCIAYDACSANADVEFCTITDMGHTWPSGDQALPVRKVGPVSYDMSFDHIWEFFKKHRSS